MTWYRRGAAALFFLCLLVLALHKIIAYDIWWQIKTGEWILAHGIPHTDPFSYAFPGREWIEPRWLFCLFVHLVHSLLGLNFLILAKAALLLLTFGLLFLAGDSRTRWPTYSGLIIALVLAQERFMVRPELVSFAALAFTLLALQRFRNGGGRSWLYPLPLLQLLWVNTHTLWILGPAVQLLALGGELLQSRLPGRAALGRSRLQALSWTAAATALVCLINPYFWSGVRFPFLLLSEITGGHYLGEVISEFVSPLSDFFFGWNFRTVSYLLAVVLSLLCFLLNHRRLLLSRAGLWLAFLVLSVTAQRNVALFGLVAGFVTLLNLQEWAADRQESRVADRVAVVARSVTLGFLLLAIPLVAGDLFYRWTGSVREFGFGLSERRFPIGALAFARQSSVPGPLLHGLGDGGYVLFEGGAESVYLDGRLEVYGVESLARGIVMAATGEGLAAEAGRVGAQAVLVRNARGQEGLFQTLESSAAWSPVYYDHLHMLYVRVSENTRTLRQRYAFDWSAPPQLRVAIPAELAAPDWLEGLWPRAGDPFRFERLGSLFAAAGNYELAQGYFEEALRVAPGDARSSLYLGLLYRGLGREEEAERLLRQAPADYASDAQVLLLAGEIQLWAGHPDAALAEFERAAALEGWRSTTAERIARAAISAGFYDRAEQELARLIEADPQRYQSWNLLAALAVRRNRLAEAVESFERSLSLQPRQVAVYETLAAIYETIGEPERAEAMRIRAHEIGEAANLQ